MAKLTYATKTNSAAITDRTKQGTAEDFNEILDSVNALYDADNVITDDITTLEGRVDTTETDIAALDTRLDLRDNQASTYDGTISMTTSETFQTKVSMSPTFTAGNYIIEVSYGWNHDSTTSSFEAKVEIDSTIEGQLHKQKPFDASGSWEGTGTDQRFYASRRFKVSLDAGSHTIALLYRTDNAGDTSAIWDSMISFKEA